MRDFNQQFMKELLGLKSSIFLERNGKQIEKLRKLLREKRLNAFINSRKKTELVVDKNFDFSSALETILRHVAFVFYSFLNRSLKSSRNDYKFFA